MFRSQPGPWIFYLIYSQHPHSLIVLFGVEALANRFFGRRIWDISFPLIRHDIEMGRPWEAHRFLAGLGIPEHLRTPYISALQNHMASWSQQQQQQSSAS